MAASSAPGHERLEARIEFGWWRPLASAAGYIAAMQIRVLSLAPLALTRAQWTYLVVGLLVLWVVWTFNRLVHQRNRVREGYSDVDVQLKRRHDLVPNLVKVVGGHAKHEQETLERVTAARGAAQQAHDASVREHAERELSARIDSLMILVEDYPELKADQGFIQLSKDLVKVEDDLQYARRYYNGTVRDYNTMLERFPTNLFARMLGHESALYFQADEDDRAAPRVAL